MGWKTPVFLLLILLGGAAAPGGDCQSSGNGGQALPLALDLTGRPNAVAGLTGQAFATAPGVEGVLGCRSALPASNASRTLTNETNDVLHGLPAPEILRPINEPLRAPQFQ